MRCQWRRRELEVSEEQEEQINEGGRIRRIRAVFKKPSSYSYEIFSRYTLINTITISFGRTYSTKFYTEGIVPQAQFVEQENPRLLFRSLTDKKRPSAYVIQAQNFEPILFLPHVPIVHIPSSKGSCTSVEFSKLRGPHRSVIVNDICVNCIFNKSCYGRLKVFVIISVYTNGQVFSLMQRHLRGRKLFQQRIFCQ